MYFYVVKFYSHCSDEKVQKAKSGHMPIKWGRQEVQTQVSGCRSYSTGQM